MCLGVLRNREFRRLWVAATIDSFGSWLLVMAVPLHVFALTGSAMSTGLALAVQALPTVVIGPWAGVVVDRWRRKNVLVVANVVAACAVALMLLATTSDRAAVIYVGLVVENVAICFLRPAVAAATPAVVGRGTDLAAANALSAFTGSAFRMLGPLVGTFLVAGGWFEVVVVMDVTSYLVAAALITRVAVDRARPPIRTATAGAATRGLRYIGRTPLLRGLLATNCLYWTANAALTALLIPFVATRLHSSGRALGYLVAGLGAGYLCGSAISKALIARYPTRAILTAAYASVGVCFLVMFTATALPIALVAVTASGVPGAVAQVVIGYRLQVSTPDAVLGRVSAAFYTSDSVAAVTGAVAGPAVVALIGLGAALNAFSAAVLATAVLAFAVVPVVSGEGLVGRGNAEGEAAGATV
ncbi:MFS transporter [Phytohabitans aurantiacus]|jgi:predicted MFS family arabinose efflux permease|uniref:MFS transporter n=1 Tax=Phytohabitans aurantiacus TaxID=3016789 RepID=A0ABQ5QPV5_9ACTN|nr:MFS transporter [Phytohabitans aurantiacus]GLH96613.1 MFS transporter [Phytohabitans aurantiacus]